jgi:hypothetical protein
MALTIHAHSDAAFRRLIGRFMAFYAERLATPEWSDIVNLGRNNQFNISMSCLGLDRLCTKIALFQSSRSVFVQASTSARKPFSRGEPNHPLSGKRRR